MLNRFFILIAMVSLLASSVLAREVDVVTVDKPVFVPFGQTTEFQFGTVPQANTTVLLHIKVRMNTPSLAGSLSFLKIKLNGTEVAAARSRSQIRLMNKPINAPVTPKLSQNWYRPDTGWNVLYAPDFQAALGESYYVGDPYLYVLDVTDLTNPVATNRLEITNTATAEFVARTAKHAGRTTDKLDLVIGEMKIEVKPQPSPMMAPVETVFKSINRGEPAAGALAYQGSVSPTGGFSIQAGDKTYRFNSKFSYPDAGFNHLTAQPVTGAMGQPEWTVKQEGSQVVARSRDYTVTRTVHFRKHRVEVSDQITNLHADKPIGLSVRHELDATELANAEVRIAGNPDPAVNDYPSFGNPPVHLATPEGGLGLLAEDDVFRYQVRLYTQHKATEAVAGIRTDMLRIPAGESYTLRWAVYPVASQDYYDFINQVRKDWDANYTTEGTWVWSGGFKVEEMTVEEIRAAVKRQKIIGYIASDWAEWQPNPQGTQRIGFGVDVLNPYWGYRHEQHRRIIAKLREAAPELKIYGYFDVMRETSEDAATKFRDSLSINASGQPESTRWDYTGAKNSSYLMVPTLENSYGKAVLEAAIGYMKQLGYDGIYWDEAENIQFGAIMLTHEGNFDGNTAILDPQTWRIVREVGIIPLASRELRSAVLSAVRRNGGEVLLNGPTGTHSSLSHRMQRMTEAQHNDVYALQGHLQTPLAYMSWADSWENYLRVLRLGLLPVAGKRPALPHDLVGHMLPFTPVEIYSGYLLGKERVIACHSGNYGWYGEKNLVAVHHFDAGGKKTSRQFVTTISNEAKTAVELENNEAIVLEKIPVTIRSRNYEAGWAASVTNVASQGRRISFECVASQGAVVAVEGSALQLAVGDKVNVMIGQSSQEYTFTGKPLIIDIPKKFSGEIKMESID